MAGTLKHIKGSKYYPLTTREIAHIPSKYNINLPPDGDIYSSYCPNAAMLLATAPTFTDCCGPTSATATLRGERACKPVGRFGTESVLGRWGCCARVAEENAL